MAGRIGISNPILDVKAWISHGRLGGGTVSAISEPISTQ
jgi:hypothetical protein